jgi:hypothetical protein
MWAALVGLFARLGLKEVLKAAALSFAAKQVAQGVESVVNTARGSPQGTPTGIDPEILESITKRVISMNQTGAKVEELAEATEQMLKNAMIEIVPEAAMRVVVIPAWYHQIKAYLLEAAAERQTNVELATRIITWLSPIIKFFHAWANEHEKLLEKLRDIMTAITLGKDEDLPTFYYNPWELHATLLAMCREHVSLIARDQVDTAAELEMAIEQGVDTLGVERMMGLMYREWRRARLIIGAATKEELTDEERGRIEHLPIPLPYSVIDSPYTLYNEPFERKCHRSQFSHLVSVFPFHTVTDRDGIEIMLHQSWRENTPRRRTALADLEHRISASIDKAIMGMSPVLIPDDTMTQAEKNLLWQYSEERRGAVKRDLDSRNKEDISRATPVAPQTPQGPPDYMLPPDQRGQTLPGGPPDYMLPPHYRGHPEYGPRR